MASNPILNVNGETRERLEVAFSLATHDKACGYVVDGNRLIFFWAEHEKMIPFPTKLDMSRCAELAFDWLTTGASYPDKPRHDGSNRKGWRCYTEGNGHINGLGWATFLAVEPHWMMYGK